MGCCCALRVADASTIKTKDHIELSVQSSSIITINTDTDAEDDTQHLLHRNRSDSVDYQSTRRTQSGRILHSGLHPIADHANADNPSPTPPLIKTLLNGNMDFLHRSQASDEEQSDHCDAHAPDQPEQHQVEATYADAEDGDGDEDDEIMEFSDEDEIIELSGEEKDSDAREESQLKRNPRYDDLVDDAADTILISEQEQIALIELYDRDRPQWRAKMSEILRVHPAQFPIVSQLESRARGESGDALQISKEELHSVCPTLSGALIECIFDDIDAFDDAAKGNGKWVGEVEAQVQIATVLRWIEGRASTSVSQRKDTAWLCRTLKAAVISERDVDGETQLGLQEFHACLDAQGVEPSMTDILFEEIDDNGDGQVSIREWAQWRQRLRAGDLAKLFPKRD